jgi:phage gp29-like protein
MASIQSLTRVTDPAQRWASGVGPVTPETVFALLSAAARGDNQAYLTLAAEMEEKYLHYSAQLSTRKLAVVGTQCVAAPADASPLAETIAADVQERLLDSPLWETFGLDLLDALGKGYSVVQPHWSTHTDRWVPSKYEWLDPRFFGFDKATLSELRLRRDDGELLQLPPGLVVHQPRLRTGVPCRGGLARPAAVAYLFQSATVSQWVVFSETFGMPIRIGRYDANTSTEDEISTLRSAVVNLGHNAAAVMPTGMSVEVLDGRRPISGDNVFLEQIRYWDALVSKLVVGQTMTADDGSSRAQAQVHNEVRLDLQAADARALASTQRQIVRQYVAYNFGEDAPAPTIRYEVEPPEDLQAFSAALAPLIAAGLRVSAREVREKFSLREPAAGEEVLTPAPKSVEVSKGGNP